MSETSDPWSRIAPQQIAEHEIHLFYEFDDIPLSGPTISLGDLVTGNPDWTPADQLGALSGRYRNEKIWEKTTGGAGADFYTHLKDIIDGRREDLATFWRLAPHAKLFLTSANLYDTDVPQTERVRKRIILTLAPRQTQRLSDYGLVVRPLSIVLDSATLHVFATGKSFAHIIVRAEVTDRALPLTVMELAEAQIALARVNELSWQTIDTGNPVATFKLNVLVRQLVHGVRVSVRKVDRTRTYTYARLASHLSPDDLDFLGFYMARHYSSDYVADPSLQGVEKVGQFKTIRHTIALEGTTTLISPDASGHLPNYLKHFITNTLRPHYIPIVLLALHEYGFLVDRTSRSVMNYDEKRDLNETLRILGRLKSDSLVFRVCYRFSQVSHITMHNELNQALRKALGLDRMMKEFAADITEIEAFLRAVREHSVETRFYWLSVIGGASLAGFAGVPIFTSIFRMLLSFQAVQDGVLKLFDGLVTKEWLSPEQATGGTVLASEAFGLALGVIIFVIACWLIGRRRPLSPVPVHGELTMQGLVEQLTKTSSRE